ncbi:hypothetical protein [Methylobacterium segetis]|uniref:hypothetical protein n=1 Tax=Methylobacterium segetis TaxID=2488750 RepID=UPI00104E393B|nr:hypothetical protein [Methylobacterium segetis]
MVTPKTGRPRGRPRKTLFDDPDRYWIAYALALQAAGCSENKAFDLAAARVYGHVDRIEEIASGELTGWTKVSVSRVERSATTIFGKASTLRRKTNVARTEIETLWLTLLARAWMQALLSKDHERNRLHLQVLGKHLGEEAFVDRVLLPILDKKSALPDFSPRD